MLEYLKYPLLLIFSDFFINLSDTAQIEKPAGKPHAFCVEERIKSIPNLSTSIFAPAIELTESTNHIISGYLFLIN